VKAKGFDAREYPSEWLAFVWLDRPADINPSSKHPLPEFNIGMNKRPLEPLLLSVVPTATTFQPSPSASYPPF
jgi:hypothetical protein